MVVIRPLIRRCSTLPSPAYSRFPNVFSMLGITYFNSMIQTSFLILVFDSLFIIRHKGSGRGTRGKHLHDSSLLMRLENDNQHVQIGRASCRERVQSSVVE